MVPILPGVTETTKPLTPRQVADRFGVSTETVAEWATSGKLPFFRTPGGQRRFHAADVDAMTATERVESEAS